MTAPQTRRGSWATIKSVCLFTLTTWFCLERANAAETPFASAAQRNLQASDGQAAAADALLASTTLQPPKQMNLPVVLADWAGDKPSPKGTQPQPTPLSAAAIKPQTASKPGPAAAAPQKSTSSAAAAMQLPRRSGSGLKRQLLLNMHHHPHGAHHNATAHRHHNKTKADANPATASSRRLVELARRHNSTKGAHTKFATTPSSGRRQLDSSGGSTDMASGRCVCTFDFDLTLRVERDGREDMPAWDAAGIIADCKVSLHPSVAPAEHVRAAVARCMSAWSKGQPCSLGAVAVRRPATLRGSLPWPSIC